MPISPINGETISLPHFLDLLKAKVKEVGVEWFLTDETLRCRSVMDNKWHILQCPISFLWGGSLTEAESTAREHGMMACDAIAIMCAADNAPPAWGDSENPANRAKLRKRLLEITEVKE